MTDFSGGIDRSRPPFLLEDRFLSDATNFYYDPLTGYPTSRPGLKKLTASAAPDGIIGVYEYVGGGVSTLLLVCEDQNLYYLDGSNVPQPIGALTGSGRPTFATLKALAVIATGEKIQTYGSGPGLVTPAASPKIAHISDHVKKDAGAIVGVGDTVNRERMHRSGINDPENWTASTEADYQYADIGYQDGMDAVGVVNFQGDTFIFKRQPYGNGRRIYRMNLWDVSTNWYCKEVTRSHTALSPHFIIEAGDVLFVDREGPKRLSVVANNGDYPFTVTPFGMRMAGEMSQFVASDGFSIYDPYKRLWMIKPTIQSSQFYCVDPATDRWTYFRYIPNIYCGGDFMGRMIFGAADGHLYEYDPMTWTDDGVSYPMSLETKWFDYSYINKNILKDKYLSVVGLTAGSLTMTVKVAGDSKYSVVIPFGEGWWSWERVNSILPEDWTETLVKTIAGILRDKKPVSGDQFSIQIAVSSGLCAVGQLGGRVATTGRQ